MTKEEISHATARVPQEVYQAALDRALKAEMRLKRLTSPAKQSKELLEWLIEWLKEGSFIRISCRKLTKAAWEDLAKQLNEALSE